MGYSYLFMAMQNPPTSQPKKKLIQISWASRDHHGTGGYDGTTGSINQVMWPTQYWPEQQPSFLSLEEGPKRFGHRMWWLALSRIDTMTGCLPSKFSLLFVALSLPDPTSPYITWCPESDHPSRTCGTWRPPKLPKHQRRNNREMFT